MKNNQLQSQLLKEIKCFMVNTVNQSEYNLYKSLTQQCMEYGMGD